MTSDKVRDRVPYHVKEELRRWNDHLDQHKKKIDGAKTTIEKNMKAVEMLDQLQRSSQYQSEQRALNIHQDNQLLLQKLSRIGSRDDIASRNSKYYEKRKSNEKRENDDMPTNSAREKEKKTIKDEKGKLESGINTEQKKQRQISKRNILQKDGVAPGPSPMQQKETVDNMRPNVLPVKLEKDRKKTAELSSYVPPWKREVPKKEDKKETEKISEIEKARSKAAHRKKVKKEKDVKRNEEEKNVLPEPCENLTDEDAVDREIDQIIVHSTYLDDASENFHIHVVEGSNEKTEEGNTDQPSARDAIDPHNDPQPDVPTDKNISGELSKNIIDSPPPSDNTLTPDKDDDRKSKDNTPTVTTDTDSNNDSDVENNKNSTKKRRKKPKKTNKSLEREDSYTDSDEESDESWESDSEGSKTKSSTSEASDSNSTTTNDTD